MDFIKTKCKQRNVNRIAKYNTRQRGKYTEQNGVKTETKGYQLGSVSDKEGEH